MKTLEDLTPEKEALIKEYYDKYTNGVFDGNRYENFNLENAINMVNWNYKKGQRDTPFVIVAENPLEAQTYYNFLADNEAIFTPLLKANADKVRGNDVSVTIDDVKIEGYEYNPIFEQVYNQLMGGLGFTVSSLKTGDKKFNLTNLKTYQNDYLFTTNIYSNSLLAFYKFIKDVLEVECEVGDLLDEWANLYPQSGIYSLITAELVCIISKYPKKLNVDSEIILHSTKSNAAEWAYTIPDTKFENYFINGRSTNADIFKAVLNGTFTFDDFNKLDNEEDKATVVTMIRENNGEQGLLSFLKAELVDEKIIEHTTNYKETLRLYKTKDKFAWAGDSNGNRDVQLAWVHFTCPSTLQDYLISVCPSINSAVDAAKDLRSSLVPKSIDYNWMSAN